LFQGFVILTGRLGLGGQRWHMKEGFPFSFLLAWSFHHLGQGDVWLKREN